MAKISIIYHSVAGTTKVAADAVYLGCETNHRIDVKEYLISDDDFDKGRWNNDEIASALDDSDAIIFGTPSYLGSVSAQLKAFMEAMSSRQSSGAWRDKVAAAFTVTSQSSDDKAHALNDIFLFAMHMGMIWCGTAANVEKDNINTGGFYIGAGLQARGDGKYSPDDIKTAEFLGKRVADLALQLD